MKAFKIKGNCYGKEHLAFELAETEAELVDSNVAFWNHAGIKDVTIEEVNMEQLVNLINDMM